MDTFSARNRTRPLDEPLQGDRPRMVMPRNPDTCEESIPLTPDLRRALEAFGDDVAFEIEGTCSCELFSGHEGPHHAMGQSTTESGAKGTDWWVSWTADAGDARLVALPQCEYDFDNGEFCLLMQDHPGPHTR